MAILERVWVIQTTSSRDDAETDDGFELEIRTPSDRFVSSFPNLAHDDRDRGRTDQYEFDLRDVNIDHSQVAPGNIRISTRGDDAWLPESFWVIGRTLGGAFHLLVARPDWPENAFFSTDPREGQTSRTLDQN